MRVTSKGQVTIPQAIREKAGLLPHTEVEFVYEGRGNVRLSRAKEKKKRVKGLKRSVSRGQRLVAQLIEAGRKYPRKMTTDEIMALTRGKP